jgi:uncharacterized protein YciI
MDKPTAADDGLLEFIYILRVTRPGMLTEGPTDEEAAAVGRHFHYLKELTEQRILLMAGRMQTTDQNTRGYVVLQAPDEKSARDLMEGDPAVEEGVMTAELFPFKVALWNSHYSTEGP